MTSSHNDPAYLAAPTPFLFGMALTFDQLNMLARHYLGDQFVEQICQGDPAYAFDQTWEDHGIDNLIVEIPGKDGSLLYLYTLAVLPSFDGTPPRVSLKSELVTHIWRKLGKPDIWKSVKGMSTQWPNNRGLPEPEWLYPRMYETIETMKRDCT